MEPFLSELKLCLLFEVAKVQWRSYVVVCGGAGPAVGLLQGGPLLRGQLMPSNQKRHLLPSGLLNFLKKIVYFIFAQILSRSI